MTIRASFPVPRPSLDLNFARARRLDPRITFTRNSIGTYVDRTGVLRTAAANEPRFDHDPVTKESLGLLIEEQRENLLLRSEEFDDASWTQSRATISANAVIAPNGTLAADKLIEDSTAASTHRIYTAAGLSFTAGTSYCFSIYAKAAERTWLYLGFHFQTTGSAFGGHGAYFDLANGALGNATGIGSSITPAGNGWYRCSIFGAATTTTSSQPTCFLAEGNGDVVIDGNGTSGIYLYGAQVEAGAFPTSYIPTAGTTVTRNADVAQITGSNFTRWYSQSEGTVFADYRMGSALSTGQILAEISDGTSSNRMAVLHTTTAARFLTFIGGSAVVANLDRTPTITAKWANAYKAGDYGSVYANNAPLTNAYNSVIAAAVLRIGNSTAGNTYNGTIKRLAYFDRRLPDATLQAITAP